MKRIKFRVLNNKGKYFIEIKTFFGWKFLSKKVGASSGETWYEPIDFSTRDGAMNGLRTQKNINGITHEFMEYPEIKITL